MISERKHSHIPITHLSKDEIIKIVDKNFNESAKSSVNRIRLNNSAGSVEQEQEKTIQQK